MDKVLSNTTPLIALADLNQLDLLHKLYDIVVIPQAVMDEITSEPARSRVSGCDRAPLIQKGSRALYLQGLSFFMPTFCLHFQVISQFSSFLLFAVSASSIARITARRRSNRSFSVREEVLNIVSGNALYRSIISFFRLS